MLPNSCATDILTETDALKAMLLIPRTPSPEPEAAPTTPEDRKVIPLTDDDPDELRSRAKEAKEWKLALCCVSID